MKASSRFCAYFGLLLLLAPSATRAADSPSAAHMRADIAFLASDRLKGRETGTPEFDMAADYVAAQMKKIGLQPVGGKGSYFQPVPFMAARAKNPGAFTLRDASGQATSLVFGQDYLVRGGMHAEVRLDAPLVFAGFGLVAPEHGRDDYRGLDIKGKIVVVLMGAPKFLQTEERAYYNGPAIKAAAAKARGAVGMILVSTPTSAKRSPFANQVRQYQAWVMTWRDAAGKPFERSALPSLGLISLPGAQKLFGKDTGRIMAAAETPAGQVAGFDMKLSLAVALHSEIKSVESKNIVGLVPGSDPKLKNEVVVLSGHLDHIGITPPVKGDSINNGAMDNAAGVATTLEVARLMRAGKPPRRSVLFLIVTGEEKGLLGADYFARNPTVPLSAISANVDLDMPLLTYDFTDVTAFGADRSSIGPSVQRAAAGMQVALAPDPMPDQGVFTRSDHYRFVEQGVPAVFLATGYANGGKAAWDDFWANHYHKPSDDLSLPIRYEAGAKFARLNYAITSELANADARASWNKGDFFAGKFAKRPASAAQ